MSMEPLVNDRALRPNSFSSFAGQAGTVRNLQLAVNAANRRHDQLDHILISGPPGLGKTTLAHIIAGEMGVNIVEVAAPSLDSVGDLAGILTTLTPGSVLFIDEVHGLPRLVEEYLYSAMEDYRITVKIGGNSAPLTLDLPPFTLVGATTREGQLTAPLRSRFGISERLELYTADELTDILVRSANLLNIPADVSGLRAIAERSRGTARYANNYLRRIRDLAQENYDNYITSDIASQGLDNLGIDNAGLLPIDRRILSCLARSDGAVGLKTISVTVGEEVETIENVYEPYLIRCGFVIKSSRGREITLLGRGHIGL